MATLQSTGIGSGLDVNGIVTQLVAAEKAPGANRIAREKTAIATEVSGLGTLKGALSGFKTSLDPMKTLQAFAIRSASSSDEDIFTASAKAGAATGSYDIEVRALAQAQQISSGVFASGSGTVVGTGQLTLSLGTTSFGVAIDSTNQTIAGIRDAINKAPDNPGVRATLVTEAGGVHLVLSSAKTGVANKIKVTTDAVGGLAQLTYNSPTDVSHYTELKPAADAEIKVATYTKTSASNTITDAIDGVTLNLKSADLGVTYTLTVQEDVNAATTRIKNFISQYNAAATQLADLGKYDASSGKGGPLLGDSLLRNISADIRRTISNPVAGLAGNYKSLADIGITTAKDGTLQLDDNKLTATLQSNFDAVGAIFGSTQGIAATLSASIGKRLEATADIATRNASLDKRSKDVVSEQAALDLRMAQVEERLRKQFQTLDSVLSKLQSTSTYLSQQLASIANISIK